MYFLFMPSLRPGRVYIHHKMQLPALQAGNKKAPRGAAGKDYRKLNNEFIRGAGRATCQLLDFMKGADAYDHMG